MGREDQVEEREVLDSIFPEEITDISETSYRLDEEESEQPIICLDITYPEEYPDVAPQLSISSPPNAPKHSRLDIQEDREQLLEALQPIIEENMGMAMVFTLVSALKESAESLMSERANAVEAEREQVRAEAEEEENRKFQGTPVNRETFLEWNARFQKEIRDEEQREREEKELWEQGLAGRADYDEGDEDAMPAVDKLKVSA
ncbi:RWD-domain-containing protein [Penicillium atrosanguineum]|nr:RWD-domain-containing protein [Penicillium atrosanguineum]